MLWQFNPYIIPFLFGAIPLSYAARIAWQRRTHLPERIFFWLAVVLLWSIFIYIIELSVTNPSLMLFLRRIQYSGGLAIPTLMLLFVLAQTGREQFITQRNVSLLLAEPVLYHLLVWTNAYHHIHWRKVEAVKVAGLVLLEQTYSSHWIFWLGVLYLYLLIITSCYLILSKMRSVPALFQRQYMALLLAILLPWATNFVDVTGLHVLKYLDVVLFGMMLSCWPLAWALFRHQLLNLTPAAHDMVIRSLSDAVFVLDRGDRLVDANPAAARLLGMDQEQIVGQPAQQLFAGALGAINLYLAKAWATQEQVRSGTGENERIHNVRITPLYNRWGQVNGRVLTVHEITQQKQVEQQATVLALEQEKVKLLQQFIDASSHDLSTPITTLLMSLKLLKHNAAQVSEQLLALHTAIDSAPGTVQSIMAKLDKLVQGVVGNSERIDISTQRLQKLLAGMLELAQLDRDFTLQTTLNDLNQLVNAALHEAAALAQAQGIALHFEPDPTLGLLRLDQREFGRVLKHLLNNALHFTPRGGQVTLKTRQEAGQALFEISDTGIGIATEELPFIFDRFYRADKARSAQTGGMGVGLAIVKRIVAGHNGKIEVTSSPGVGTTFSIKLPL